MTFLRFVVVRKRAIKWILARSEFPRHVVAPLRRARIVVSAVGFRPILVPRAGFVRDGIILARRFANPENRRHNLLLPGIMLARQWWRRSQMVRGEDGRVIV